MELLKQENKTHITSLELTEQINFFRKQFEDKSELTHSKLLRTIRDEFQEELAESKIGSGSYLDKNQQERPLFNLTLSQAKQVLVRESRHVRKAVIKYLEELEQHVQVQQSVSTDANIAKRLRAEAMDRNSRTRQAQLISKFADKVSPIAHDLLLVHATELMLQKSIEYKPEVKNTYSAGAIAKKLGCSAQKIGRLATKHNLKTEENGIFILSKSRHSNKQVSTFEYFEHMFDVFEKYLD